MNKYLHNSWWVAWPCCVAVRRKARCVLSPLKGCSHHSECPLSFCEAPFLPPIIWYAFFSCEGSERTYWDVTNSSFDRRPAASQRQQRGIFHMKDILFVPAIPKLNGRVWASTVTVQTLVWMGLFWFSLILFFITASSISKIYSLSLWYAGSKDSDCSCCPEQSRLNKMFALASVISL